MRRSHTLHRFIAVAATSALTLLALSGVAPPAEARGLEASGAVFTMTNEDTGNAVVAFRRSARGRLSYLGTFDTGGLGSGGGLGNQGGLVLDRDGHHLLVVNAGSDSLSVFRVRPRGLKLVDTVASGGTRPISVTTHGDLVYVLNAGGLGNISGFELGTDGSLSPLAGSTRPLSGPGTAPAQVGFSRNGRALVVTEKATNTIVSYVLGSDGLPSGPIVTASEGATPFGFSFGHRNRLFVSEAVGGAFEASTVSSYDLLANGSLTPITSALATTETAACWLVVTGNGRFAYVTNTGSDSVSGIHIARSGVLSLLDADGATGQAGDAPIDAALSRNSRFLYVLNAADDSLSAFAVHADGSLASLNGIGGLPASVNGLAAR